MAELTVDLTYGSALLQAAQETGKKDVILEEAEQVLEIFRQEPDLYALINYPAISAKEKREVLKNVFQGRISQELLNLLYILIDKGRTGRFPKIIQVYREIINKEEGCVYGTIYSVEPLRPDQIEKFEEEVSRLLQSRTKLENQLNPRLIGGIKILVDGRIIDASIQKRFEDLRSKIL